MGTLTAAAWAFSPRKFASWWMASALPLTTLQRSLGWRMKTSLMLPWSRLGVWYSDGGHGDGMGRDQIRDHLFSSRGTVIVACYALLSPVERAGWTLRAVGANVHPLDGGGV